MELRIELESVSAAYFCGQHVNGHLCLYPRAALKTRAISITLSGKAATQWSTRGAAVLNRGARNPTLATTTSSETVYLDENRLLWRPSGDTKMLAAGAHRLPFAFVLPPSTPPSFEGAAGSIRYALCARVERRWHTDATAQATLTVAPFLDLSRVAAAALPATQHASHTLAPSMWLRSGRINAKVALPKTGFALGENVPLDVQIDNQSHRNIVRVECCLIQRATFAATSPQLAIEKRDESRFVTTWREAFKVKKRSSAAYCRTLKIPTGGCVPTFSVVQLLQVDYTLGVRLVTKDEANGALYVELPIIIGSLPIIVGLQPIGTLIEAPPSYAAAAYAPPLPSAPPCEADD